MFDASSQQVEELLKVAREAKREDMAMADVLRRLIANPDFQLYQSKVLGPRIIELQSAFLEPAAGIDGMVRTEFLKGALFAFHLSHNLPSVIVKATEEELKTAQKE